MSLSFELTDDTREHKGETLYRIRATEDNPLHGVKAGDLGGWVTSTHVGDTPRISGQAWVADDATVAEHARISGNAHVSAHALISGHARVYGDARVSSYAWVSDHARVSGNAQLSGTTHVRDYANIGGNACISSDIIVGGNTRITEHPYILS